MQRVKQKQVKQSPKLQHALILLLLLCVTGCAREICNTPPWPIAGQTVAAELDFLPPTEFPALYEWLARLEKLRDQLERR